MILHWQGTQPRLIELTYCWQSPAAGFAFVVLGMKTCQDLSTEGTTLRLHNEGPAL